MIVGFEAWLATANPKWRIGLLSHQAALLRTGETSAQAARRVFGKNLIALFGPEHGFFGAAAAGEKTATQQHPTWGIPVHSLYGEHRKPTPEMLQGLDLLVVDLQDLAVRCFTYLATLKLTLEACAEQGLPCVVCDRPHPFAGMSDGPIAEPDHFSFVAPCALPLVHGKTQSEIADWLNLPHQSAPMVDATPGYRYPSDAPVFFPPSPAIRSWETAEIYPATVFAEALPQIDILRTSAYAFRVLCAPWFEGETLARKLNQIGIPGVQCFDFTPSAELGGIRLHVTDRKVYRPWQTTQILLDVLRDTYGDEHLFKHPQARPEWMTKLLGTETWKDAWLKDK